MRLAEFIRSHSQAIGEEWESFASSLFPAEGNTSARLLRDHIQEILDAIVHDIEARQSSDEQSQKAQGHGAARRMEAVGQVHARLRIECGFRVGQLIAEYRALRATILRLWQQDEPACDLQDMIRCNEAIDEALTEAANRYEETMNRYRDLFLGIVGHDLRNPLGGILMSATAMSMSEALDDKSSRAATRIVNSANRMSRMINDLLDLTRTRLGSGIPIQVAPMNLIPVCRQVIAELEALHPERVLSYESDGDLDGEWDGDRLAQLLSNLVGNAIQHGAPGRPIRLAVRGQGDIVVIEVHNEGPAIPEKVKANMFEPMVRYPIQEEKPMSSLGLGLFISREIAASHGAKLTVTSSDADGTTFTIRLPRRCHAPARPDVN